MNNQPTLKEWMVDNPGKTLNDYYQLYPDQRVQSTIETPIYQQPQAPKPERKVDNIFIFAAIGIIIGFFMPWIDVKFGRYNLVNQSGLDLPYVLKHFTDFSDAQLKTIFLIPFSAVVLIISEFIDNAHIKMIGVVFLVVTIVLWVVYLKLGIETVVMEISSLKVNIWRVFGIGLYLSIIGAGVCVVSLFRG